MKKADRKLLDASLSKALAPRRPRQNLDAILDEYDEPERPAAAPPAISSPAEISSPPATFAAPEESAPAVGVAAPAILPPQPLQSSAPEGVAAPEIFSHPEQHTRVPNELFDQLLPTLKTSEQSVLLRLYRLTWGFQKDTCHVSMRKLGNACNLSPRQVTTCVQALERRRIIRRVVVDLDNRQQSDRGVTYQMLLPAARAKSSAPAKSSPAANPSAPAKFADNKIKDLKGNSKRGINRLTPEEIQSFTSTVADLLREGKPIEEIERQYAPSMHPVDWVAVRSTALASVKR